MARPIITLTTDYGTTDHLVGVLKGVILSINPEVNIIDITHRVIAHDVLDGALTIGHAYKYFPPKTIHLVVVDPGSRHAAASSSCRGRPALFCRAR